MSVMHRVGYAVVKTLLAFAVFTLPPAPLKHPEPSVSLVLVLSLCSFTYIRLQGSDPGFLTEDLLRTAMMYESDDANLLTTEEEDDDDEDHTDKLSSSIHREKLYRLRRIQQIQQALEPHTTTDDEDDADAFDHEIDVMQRALEHQPLQSECEAGQVMDGFCVECSLFPPLRSHHCRTCDRCVATFDHHCHLVGTCIGERNHAKFWWFLLWQTVEVVVGILVISARFQPPPPKGSWTHTNGWPLFLVILLSLVLLLVGSLLAFHTFLAMTAMTTYEVGRGTDHIAYLRGFRECDLPFSRGLFSNLALFCWPRPPNGTRADSLDDLKTLPNWLPRLWSPPTPILHRDSENICENVWENKYYSCC